MNNCATWFVYALVHNGSMSKKPGLSWRGNVAQIIVSAAIFLWAVSQQWANIRVDDKGLPSINVHLSGSKIQPLFVALALVAIAGAVSLLTIRGTVVKLVVFFILATGVYLTYQSVSVHDSIGTSNVVRNLVADQVGRSEVTYGAVTGSYAYLFATLAAAMIVTTAYQMLKQEPPLNLPVAPSTEKPVFDVKLGSAWKQLDQGQDPTDS